MLGTISVVTILWTVTKTFLAGNEQFRWLLLFEFLIGVGLSIYLIYSVPNEPLYKQVFNPVISAMRFELAE